MLDQLPQELLGPINKCLPSDKDKQSFMYTCKATRYADSILAQLRGINMNVSGSVQDVASQIIGFPLTCPAGEKDTLEIRISGHNPSAFIELCWMKHRWRMEVGDVLERVNWLVINMDVPFAAHHSRSLARALMKASPLLDVLHLDFRSCHVPSLLEALADAGQELGSLAIENNGESETEAGASALAESILQIVRFSSSLTFLDLAAGCVYDVSALSKLCRLQLLNIPFSCDALEGLSVLAYTPTLSDLSLQSLPTPVFLQSLARLTLNWLDAEGVELLFLSHLSCLKELEVDRFIDDPCFPGYGSVRGFPLVWDHELWLLNGGEPLCSPYLQAVSDVVPLPGGVIGLHVCELHVCACDVEHLVTALKPQGLRKIVFHNSILDEYCLDRARQLVEEVELEEGARGAGG